MQSNVWHSKKPLYILAPMEDVTDTVFRRIVAQCGAPDIFFTEFTNAEGIGSDGHDMVVHRLDYTEGERPIIAQIWGKTPLEYFNTAQMIVEKGFDGIDINFGCPVHKIVKQGCCSALINNPILAVEIIEAVKRGVDGKIPVSVKTRIGFDSVKTEEWVTTLLDTGIDALTIHGRTAKQMSTGSADWDEVAKAVEIRDRMGIDTIIIGNGDVQSLSDADVRIAKYGVDGVMIGRGIFNNPWLFNREVDIDQVTIEQRLELLLQHSELFATTWGERKNYATMKKFFKVYISGFSGAADLRGKLMECRSHIEVVKKLSLVG